jgi:hypothetical protein
MGRSMSGSNHARGLHVCQGSTGVMTLRTFIQVELPLACVSI